MTNVKYIEVLDEELLDRIIDECFDEPNRIYALRDFLKELEKRMLEDRILRA